jgi:hypothetical protein
VLQQVYRVLGDLVSLAGCTPKSVGDSDAWVRTVDAAKRDKLSLSKILKGKSFYSAVYGTYSVTLSELKTILQRKALPSRLKQSRPLARHQWKQKMMASANNGAESGIAPQTTRLLVKEVTRK